MLSAARRDEITMTDKELSKEEETQAQATADGEAFSARLR